MISLEQFRADYDWELVQAKDSRSVYRLSQNSAVKAYAKVYHPQDIFQKLTNRISPRTAREAATLRQLDSCGLPVPAVLGEYREGNSSTLVTAAIVPGTPLHDLPIGAQPAIMLELAVKLLKAGFVHNDLHAGNIVINQEGAASLIDTYAIRSADIQERHVKAMLAQVLSLYPLIAPAELNAALLALNCRATKLATAIRSQAHAIARRRANRFTERCERSSSMATTVQEADFKALVFGQQAPDLKAIAARHRQNIADHTNLLKIQDKTQISIACDYCVKSYRPARPFTKAYALRSWRGLLSLKFNGFNTAELVAALTYPDRSSLLVTGFIRHRSLDRFLFHDFAALPLAQRYRLSSAFGALIGRLHARGLYHADLKACNVMIDPTNAAYYFIDTDRVECHEKLSRSRRIKNLVQINNSIPRAVATTLRWRFIKSYAEQTGEQAKPLFGLIWKKSEFKEILYTTDAGDQREFWR